VGIAIVSMLPLCYEKKRNKKNHYPDIQNVKKVKTKLEMYASDTYLHIKIKVTCIICIKFLTSPSLFLNILTIYK